jgi:serine/threonine-protein kinase
MKIGHFEILSELAKSATGAVYKVSDPQNGQTVALKAIQLSAFGEYSAELEKCLLEEAENTKQLNQPNITTVYGASAIEGQLCAAMEYIQGNSIATMLARKEGFSIWDLLDIGRQVCSGLDHAHNHKVFHYGLEPAKIMCGWDGTVRILGFGMSSVGRFTRHMPSGVPALLHYMSPEQVHGEAIDARSNLFSLGAIFYEMVTDQKAFDGEDSDSLRQSITESEPPPPLSLNPKLHPLLSDLVMKALAKDPEQRYQSGRELLDDLESCKESKAQAAKKAVEAPKASAVPDQVKAAAQAKFIASAAPQPSPAKPASAVAAQVRPAAARASSAPPPEKRFVSPASSKAPAQAATPEPTRVPKAAAAAAARVAGAAPASATDTPELDISNQFVSSCVKATIGAAGLPVSSMSAATLEPAVEAPEAEKQGPTIAFDPMMAAGGPTRGSSVSFSEISELPPLKKEVFVAPPPPPPPPFEPEVPLMAALKSGREPEKPKIQPREVAGKAIKEIKNVPPRLMMYSIAGAAVLILIIAVGLFVHIHDLNSDDDSARSSVVAAPQAATQTAAQLAPVHSQPQSAATTETQPPAAPDVAEPVPTRAASGARNSRKKPVVPVAPVIVPGQMAIDSTPQGAQVQVDGKTDPTWITPFTLSGVNPGQHAVAVSKAGYSTDTRTIEVASGTKLFVVTHLAQLLATLAVSSNPAGANVYVDGKDTGKTTPAQVSVDKGQHVVVVRKSGYIDETTSAPFVLGQTVSFSPSLRQLGNVDDIKTVGKMKKLFGGGAAQGMGQVSVKTEPKGAQIAVNQHMLEKNSPVEFMLDPGNYVVDITLSGYAPVHKIITVDKGGKVVVDESLQRQ